MDEIAPGAPVPTVEYETCGRCGGSLYRGVSADGTTRGRWHHHDQRMKHEPELYLEGEQEMIVDFEISESAEIAKSPAGNSTGWYEREDGRREDVLITITEEDA